MLSEFVFQKELSSDEISATGIVGTTDRLFWVLHNLIDPHPTRGGIYNQQKILTNTASLLKMSNEGLLKNQHAVPPGLLH